MSPVLYTSTRPPGQTGAGTTDERGEQAWIDLALIAEARARARRRRRRIALLIALLVGVVGGLLVAHMVEDVRMEVKAKPAPTGASIASLGVVIGHLDACAALPSGRPVTPGMVTVYLGKETWKRTGHGGYQLVLPKTAVAHQYISNNYSQTFSFTLPPGRYVIVGRYKAEAPAKVGALTFSQVTIGIGQLVHADLPNLCE